MAKTRANRQISLADQQNSPQDAPPQLIELDAYVVSAPVEIDVSVASSPQIGIAAIVAPPQPIEVDTYVVPPPVENDNNIALPHVETAENINIRLSQAAGLEATHDALVITDAGSQDDETSISIEIEDDSAQTSPQPPDQIQVQFNDLRHHVKDTIRSLKRCYEVLLLQSTIRTLKEEIEEGDRKLKRQKQVLEIRGSELAKLS